MSAHSLTVRDFDFDSIMLYEPNAFAKDPDLITIESKLDSVRLKHKIEKRVISAGDVFNVNHLYNCKKPRAPVDDDDIMEYAD